MKAHVVESDRRSRRCTRAVLIAAVCAALWPRASSAQTFTRVLKGDVTADSSDSNGAAWIDFDNDGDEDLFVTAKGPSFIAMGYNLLYRNDGDDTFTRVREGELVNLRNAAYGVSWADFDNDGNLDVFVANGISRIGSLVYRGDGKGEFTRNEQWSLPNDVILGWSGAWGDYDNDGFVDLLIVHAFGFLGTPASRNWLFHNNGDGSFSQVSNTPIVTAGTGSYTVPSWSDYDQDGDLDLFIGFGPANGTLAPDFLYKNMLKESGKATFQRITTGVIATDSLDGQNWNWIDYDNDGDLDAYVTNYHAPGGMRNHLYRNDGGTYARDTTAGAIVTDRDVSLGNLWGDFDNDGDLDVFVTNGGRNPVNRYYRNNGDGTFTSVKVGAATEGGPPSWGSAAADYDNDGDVDLFVSNKLAPPGAQGGRPQRMPDFLFRNDLRNGNHWLTIRCVGTKSNRAGIGARVIATARIRGKTVTQRREVNAQNTFNGHSSLRVHIGFGDATVADSIAIYWPSGTVDVHRNVSLDRVMVATEGAGISENRPVRATR